MLNRLTYAVPSTNGLVDTANGKDDHSKSAVRPIDPGLFLGDRKDRPHTRSQSKHVRFSENLVSVRSYSPEKLFCSTYSDPGVKEAKQVPYLADPVPSAVELRNMIVDIYDQGRELHAGTAGFKESKRPYFNTLTKAEALKITREELRLPPNTKNEAVIRVALATKEMQEEQLEVMKHELNISSKDQG